MNYEEARDLTDKLTLLNKSKLSLRAAELSYPIYKKYDPSDTVVIAAINATRAYTANPCEETADEAYETAHAAFRAAEEAYEDYASEEADAAWSAAFAVDAPVNAPWAVDAIYLACNADSTIEAKIREYAAKLLAEQAGDRTC